MNKFYVGAGLTVGLSFAAVGYAGVPTGLCITGWGASEFIEFAHPSDIVCMRRRGPDFGQPPGCDDVPQPHNRRLLMTALGSTDFTPVVSGASLMHAWHVYDAEHFDVRGYL
jgi:hypothetical protein